MQRLALLESTHPELKSADSPTHRVGSDLSHDFPEVDHTIPVLSLDKAYSVGDVLSWVERISTRLDDEPVFVVEEKLDGVSIVLYYELGVLARAVTRGNGRVGNDVTANVRTIRDVPLRLSESVDVAVRGEIILPTEDFARLNERLGANYANPRNLAAGTLRRAKSQETAAVPLSCIVYEGFFSSAGDTVGLETHRDTLVTLARLGFRLNPYMGFFSAVPLDAPIPSDAASLAVFSHIQTGTLDDLASFVERETNERDRRGYEIDGLVVKVDSIERRRQLGYTGHHPRWAIAYKFESPVGVTTLRSIDIQVGRTGRITPVARVEPVFIGGTTVSNVTLHNQAYIDALEVAPGDIVEVSRRGDVIPAVERVIEKSPDSELFAMPTECPSCGEPLTVDGAHHFCTNFRCPDRMRGQLFFFVAAGQMDIQYLGAETLNVLIENGMVSEIPDIYEIDYDRLQELPGFGRRKVSLLKESVERSRHVPFRTVLASLGIPEVGPKFVELVCDAGYRSIDALFELADTGRTGALTDIDGIGEKTAETALRELSRESVRTIIRRLRDHGLHFEEQPADADRADISEERRTRFSGQSWCITGSFERFQPRSQAGSEIKSRGGRVVTDVTGKTTHLLAGRNPGTKLKKAQEKGVVVVSEDEFISLLDG